MTTIWERLSSALTPLGLPLAANVMLAATGSPLPNQYLVYFDISSPPLQHADDLEKSMLHHIQVSYYSRTGFTGTSLTALFAAMKAAGFTKGPMRELPYNPDGRFFGLCLEFYFLEEE